MTGVAQHESVVAEWAAVRTIATFFRHLDDRDYDRASALFGEDGCWVRLGARLTGARAIKAALADRPATLATRHVMSNVIAAAEPGESEVRVRYYITVFDDESGTPVPVLAAPAALFDADDRLRRVGHAWQFVERAPRLVFKRG